MFQTETMFQCDLIMFAEVLTLVTIFLFTLGAILITSIPLDMISENEYMMCNVLLEFASFNLIKFNYTLYFEIRVQLHQPGCQICGQEQVSIFWFD